MPAGEHLLSVRTRLLRLSDDQRIAEIQKDDVWIEYPQTSKILDVLGNMLSVTDRIQAPCIMVGGEGGTGKTSIINQIKTNPTWRKSLVFLALNENPFGLKFRELIVEALGVPHNFNGGGRTTKSVLPRELLEVIRLRQVKGIVIDEFHDAMLVSRIEQQKNLSLLKGLSGAPLSLSIFGFGTMSAKNALTFDPQLNRRFYKVDLEDWDESETFRSFLAGVEENLPLKLPSALYNPEIVQFLLVNTGGRMDDVIKLIKSAAAYAIRSGEERITLKQLDAAAAKPWNY